MKILDRYIGITVLKTSALVMLILLALFTFITFTDELRKVGKGSYDTWAAAEYAIMTIPRMVYQLFPATALIGSLVGLGILANSSELTAMRAAGVSVAAITRSVLKVGAIMVLAVALIGEYVAPKAERYAETQRSLAMSDKIALQTSSGLWVREGFSFVNIQNIYEGGRLGNVAIFDFDRSHRLTRVTRAAEAVHQGSAGWLLRGLNVTHIEGGNVTTTTQREEARPSLLSPGLLDAVAVTPETMSALALYRYAAYLRDNGLDAGRYLQALWSKLMTPIGTGIMVLLAIPFVFGPLRSASVGYRVLIGTMLGISFHILSEIFNYIGLVYQINPALAASLPPTLFLLIAWRLMSRVH